MPKKFCKQGLYNVYSTTNIFHVFKSRRMGHVKHTGQKRTAYRISVRIPERKG